VPITQMDLYQYKEDFYIMLAKAKMQDTQMD
jgi:hypothetical protein